MLPYSTLTTSRLVLRPFTQEDAPSLFRLRSSEEVMQYIGRPRHRQVSEAEEMIRNFLKMVEEGHAITWAIALKDDPRSLIGTIGLWQWQREHHRAEIGYLLDPAHHRKGLMSEAIPPVLRYGKEVMQLHSVEAKINPLNRGSSAVLERVGFIQEGYLRESFFWNGRFEDTGLYGIVLR